MTSPSSWMEKVMVYYYYYYYYYYYHRGKRANSFSMAIKNVIRAVPNSAHGNSKNYICQGLAVPILGVALVLALSLVEGVVF